MLFSIPAWNRAYTVSCRAVSQGVQNQGAEGDQVPSVQLGWGTAPALASRSH